jgi:hypothetical protein
MTVCVGAYCECIATRNYQGTAEFLPCARQHAVCVVTTLYLNTVNVSDLHRRSALIVKVQYELTTLINVHLHCLHMHLLNPQSVKSSITWCFVLQSNSIDYIGVSNPVPSALFILELDQFYSFF